MNGDKYSNQKGENAETYTRNEGNTSTESENCSQDFDPPPSYGCVFSGSSNQSNEEDKVKKNGPKMADEKVNKNFAAKCEDVASEVGERIEDLASDAGHRIETCAMKVGHYIENYASRVGHRIENFACPEKIDVQEQNDVNVN